MDLSVVIPAYNEANRLPRSLPKIFSYLQKQSYTSEVIVVDDGSTDGTAACVSSFVPPVRFIQHPRNLGKGAAVRTGMLSAQGEWRYLCDADLSSPIEELGNFWARRLTAEIVIGSRRAPGAHITRAQAAWKVRLGQLGNLLIRWLLVPGVYDTRCGFKLFSRQAAGLFELQRLERWGYDDEILFLARQQHLRILEIPVVWENSEQSKVTKKDYLKSLFEIVEIRFNYWRGRYALPKNRASKNSS